MPHTPFDFVILLPLFVLPCAAPLALNIIAMQLGCGQAQDGSLCSVLVTRSHRFPYPLALATLIVVEQGDDALRRDRSPKISRAQLGRILADAHAAADDDHALLHVSHQSGAPPTATGAARPS